LNRHEVRRLEVDKGWDQFGHQRVLMRRLAWEAIKDVPRGVDTKLRTPL